MQEPLKKILQFFASPRRSLNLRLNLLNDISNALRSFNRNNGLLQTGCLREGSVEDLVELL